MSISWYLDVEPAPAILVLPPDAASLDEAHAAVELWEHYSRKKLDPAQRLTVEVMMAETAGGLWAALTTGREMPRQNGKGDEVEVPELWGLVQRGEAILHTVHDAVLLASQTQQRMLSILDGHADLRRLVKRKWLGVGQQMIEMRNGGIIWYRTRTGGGGRGIDDIDRLVVDEAQHATEEHLSAITPTLLANRNPQLNALGTAGLLGRSDWWWSVRRRALSDDPGRFGYVGHTAERVELDGERVTQSVVDVQDRAGWIAANPSLLAGRGQGMPFLEEQLRRLGPDAFAREHLCVWDPLPSDRGPAAKLPTDKWADTLTSRPPTVVSGELAMGYDVVDGWASVSIASGTLAQSYVECIRHQSGAGWLPRELVELVRRWSPSSIGLDGGCGPAVAVLGEIREAFQAEGLNPELLRPLTSGEYKAACGSFFQSVCDGKLSRPRVEPDQLDVAGRHASERVLGDSFVWGRRTATVPLSPLVAATVARALLPTSTTTTEPMFAFSE